MIELILLARMILVAQGTPTQATATPAPTTQPASVANVANVATDGGKVIVRLVCREQTVSVISTSAGVRYSAADSAGHELFSALPLADVKANHPEIYRLIAPTICSAEDKPVAIGMVDAD